MEIFAECESFSLIVLLEIFSGEGLNICGTAKRPLNPSKIPPPPPPPLHSSCLYSGEVTFNSLSSQSTFHTLYTLEKVYSKTRLLSSTDPYMDKRAGKLMECFVITALPNGRVTICFFVHESHYLFV